MMRDLNVCALPICGEDDKLTGILTDRDIVVKCIAVGKDPAKMTAAELARVKGLDPAELKDRLRENARRVFGVRGPCRS